MNKDKTKIISKSELFKEYSSVITHAGNGTKLGERILRSRELIFGRCDNCDKDISSKYSTIKEREDFLCQGCRVKRTKFERYGESNYNNYSKMEKTKLEKYGHPRFCNKKKAMETCERRYGVKSIVPKGINKGIKRTQAQKDNVSVKNKLFYSNKENHPMFGKFHSEEAKEKNRQSQLAHIDKYGLTCKASKKYVSGKFFSEKTNRLVHYRSSYEQKFFNLLEINPEVIFYRVEPYSVKYFYKDKEHRYFPDVEVIFHNKKFLLEIKPECFKNDPVVLIKKEFAERWCKDKNLEYQMIFEKDIFGFIFRETSIEGLLKFPKEFLNLILNNARSVALRMINKENSLCTS